MFTQKTLLAGLAAVVIIGGVAFFGSRAPESQPAANLDTVSERAKNLMEESSSTVVTTEATTSEAVVVTPEPAPEPVETVPAKAEPKPAMTATPAPAPVVTTPKPEPVPTPTPVATGITKAEVATHANVDSCWSIINGSVYDLTSYIPRHPGGKGEILAICGKDGSRLFEGQHGGDSKPERILAGFYIDDLAS